MPQASYRSQFGVARDAVNTTLSAAVLAGATSVPIVGTGVAASSTITIVDGPLTESRAVTAGGGTSTLTVTALTNAHSSGAYVTAQLTASLGPADWIPVTVLDVQDSIVQLKDKGLRGSAVEEYGNVQGIRKAMVTVGGDLYVDTFPYWVGSVTGAVDYTGGSPNTHAFSPKNTGDTQPTPLTIWDFNAVDTRIYAGAKTEELAVKLDPNGLMTYQAKFQGYSSGPVAAVTASYGTIQPSQAWLVVATIGGTVVAYVQTADVTLKRVHEPILTLNGVQDPYKFWLGAAAAEGKLLCVMEDNTQLNNFLNNSQPSLDLKFTATGANPAFVQFHATKCNFEDATKPKQIGKGYVEIEIPFRCLSNTTDATTAGTGYAPMKTTVGNAKTGSTYYQ